MFHTLVNSCYNSVNPLRLYRLASIGLSFVPSNRNCVPWQSAPPFTAFNGPEPAKGKGKV